MSFVLKAVATLISSLKKSSNEVDRKAQNSTRNRLDHSWTIYHNSNFSFTLKLFSCLIGISMAEKGIYRVELVFYLTRIKFLIYFKDIKQSSNFFQWQFKINRFLNFFPLWNPLLRKKGTITFDCLSLGRRTWVQLIDLYPDLVSATASTAPSVASSLKQALLQYGDLLQPPVAEQNNGLQTSSH